MIFPANCIVPCRDGTGTFIGLIVWSLQCRFSMLMVISGAASCGIILENPRYGVCRMEKDVSDFGPNCGGSYHAFELQV